MDMMIVEYDENNHQRPNSRGTETQSLWEHKLNDATRWRRLL
jgi:hypothetical protein